MRIVLTKVETFLIKRLSNSWLRSVWTFDKASFSSLCNPLIFCSNAGLDYVSCSPYRVPIARLAAAQAELIKKKNK